MMTPFSDSTNSSMSKLRSILGSAMKNNFQSSLKDSKQKLLSEEVVKTILLELETYLCNLSDTLIDQISGRIQTKILELQKDGITVAQTSIQAIVDALKNISSELPKNEGKIVKEVAKGVENTNKANDKSLKEFLDTGKEKKEDEKNEKDNNKLITAKYLDSILKDVKFFDTYLLKIEKITKDIINDVNDINFLQTISLFATLSNFFSKSFSGITNFFSKGLSGIKNFFSKSFSGITNFFSKGLSGIKNFFSKGFGNIIATTVKIGIQMALMLAKFTLQIISTFVILTVNLLATLVPMIVSVITTITLFLIKMIAILVPMIVSVIMTILTGLATLVSILVPVLITIISGIVSIIATILGIILPPIAAIVIAIISAVATILAAIITAIGPIAAIVILILLVLYMVYKAFEDKINEWKEKLSNWWNNSTIKKWWDDVQAKGGLWEYIKGILKDWWNTAKEIISKIWNWACGLWDKLVNWFNDLWIVKTLKAKWEQLETWWKGFSIKKIVTNIKDWFINWWNGFCDKAASWSFNLPKFEKDPNAYIFKWKIGSKPVHPFGFLKNLKIDPPQKPEGISKSIAQQTMAPINNIEKNREESDQQLTYASQAMADKLEKEKQMRDQENKDYTNQLNGMSDTLNILKDRFYGPVPMPIPINNTNPATQENY